MEAIIKHLISIKVLKSRRVIEAFKKIRRADFLPAELKMAAAEDSALPIGFGQTNSQPMTVALMFELLGLEPGNKVLDVGSGSGWTAALGAQLVGKSGKVYGLEIIPELAEFARQNVSKYDFITSGRIEILTGDGYAGLPGEAPFDRIMVAAAAESVPDKLKAQLAVGGRMIIPIGREGRSQDLTVINKVSSEKFEEKRYPGFIFVPLVRK